MINTKTLFSSFLMGSALLCLNADLAHAYLDPGTGGYVINSVMAVVAGAIVSLKVYWGRISFWFQSKFNKK
ncbi:MAG: hypothetical protein AAGI66_02140 [Cyanobacteria bacterium P01_H01_bin.74]